MTLGASELYSRQQLKGLNKLGDQMIPANEEFPSFSQTGCIEYIDTVMGAAHKDDQQAFGLLLWVLSYTPTLFIQWLLKLLDKTETLPPVMAGPFRLLNVSLRGVVYTLYYSNKTAPFYRGNKVFDVIDYHVHCKPDQA